MSKSNNYNISLVDEGYEDLIAKRVQEEKEKIRKQQEEGVTNKDLNILTGKNLIILVVWGLLYKFFIKYGFGLVYFMISIIVFIFTNLGKREAWQLSAYSVFNPNFERLPGTFTVNDIAAGMGMSSISRTEGGEEGNNQGLVDINNQNHANENLNSRLSKHDLWKKQMKEKAKLPLKTPCPCGSNKKYKNCCLLKEE